MREYPTGMCLLIPTITSNIIPSAMATQKRFAVAAPIGSQAAPAQETTQEKSSGKDYIEVKYDLGHKEITFLDKEPCPVRNGDWVLIIPTGRFVLHAHEHIFVVIAHL